MTDRNRARPERKPSPAELTALAVALVLAFGVATYFGNLVAGIAVAVAVVIAGSGFLFTRKEP